MSTERSGHFQGSAEWHYGMRPDSARRRIQRKVATAPGPSAALRRVTELLASADIEIGGNRPWDLQVHDERFFQRVLSYGSMAAGESYMDGWWDAEALDELCARVHLANIAAKVGEWKTIFLALKGRIFNRQR